MGTCIGIGVSHHRNPKRAAKEAVQAARQQGNLQQPDFVILFATVGYPQEILLKAVRTETQQIPLIGCSAAGVIAVDKADESNFSVAVMVIQSDELTFHHGVAAGLQASSVTVGKSVGADLRPFLSPDAAAIFLFPDGLTCNFAEFSRGLGRLTEIDHFLPIVGGLAGDNLVYEKTYQYCDDQVISDGVAWSLLSGPLKLISANSHGCVPIGRRRKITKCDRNCIYEIDHLPVFDVIQEYLSPEEMADWSAAAANLGMAFLPTDGEDIYQSNYVLCMIAKDDEAGTLSLHTEVPEGSEFWFTRRDRQKIRAGVEATAASLVNQLGENTPKLIFQVECDGRGKTILPEKEKLLLLDTLQSTLGKHIPWFGLYAYGELAPVGAENCIHNFTGITNIFY